MPDPVKAEIPRDQSLTQRVSSPMATISSVSDPYPHYIMSAACGCQTARSSSPLADRRDTG